MRKRAKREQRQIEKKDRNTEQEVSLDPYQKEGV